MTKNKENKRNNNVFWIGWNSFFTDMSSEMIKPLLPIYLKVILQAPVWLITLFNTLSDFLANIFKIIFGIKSDNKKDKKKLILLWYATSNFFKPLMFIFQSIYWLFTIELINRIWKWIRSAPKEVLMTYSIEENKLWKWFWFQKAMDSFWAFAWTILISLLLFLFWLDYNINFVGINLNLFYIIMLLTIIPWFISYSIIVKKVRNVYINKEFEEEISKKKKNKLLVHLDRIFQLGDRFYSLMVFIFLLSIWNIALVFFILQLIHLNFEPYQITLFYSLYTLSDALFSYKIGKISDKKNWSKSILIFSLLVIFLTLFISYFIGISKDFIWIIIWILIFSLLWIFEASFEGTFKKVIVDNIEKKDTGTAMGVYFWISWITKIFIALIMSYAWMQGKIDAIFWFWFLFITISIIYFIYLFKYKKINI